jgi:NAD(P)H-dependent FMN reductase
MRVVTKGQSILLAISGSLRSGSVNTAVVQALSALAPEWMTVSVYGGLADLPPFNPDHDSDPPHPAVAAFRAALTASDVVLICTPEYAHGVPGVLKNALDWVVGSGELIDKPVVLVNAAPRATHAYGSLRETLTVMSAAVVREESMAVMVNSRTVDPAAICADAAVASALRSTLESLAPTLRRSSSNTPLS